MTSWLYRILCRAGRLLGVWFFALCARIVAGGYFLFSPNVRESNRFYARLFPGRNPLFYRWCSFLQYQRFTSIHVDRFLTNISRQEPSFSSSGWERLAGMIDGGGGILLMSHLGNWEMAAHLLKRQRENLRILLYMGIKEKEGVERSQKEDLLQAGVTIIGVARGESSPLGVVEGVSCLRDGGVVSLAGDVAWGGGQRQVEVSFLGGRALLPVAPYVLALLSGAPLLAFFSFRTGRNAYAFDLSEPIVVQSAGRRDRDRAIAAAAQQYADLLAVALRRHPFEWYHFDRFIQ